MIEMILPQAKRIKLEHSYAYSIGNTFVEPVRIKEEDPLQLSENADVADVLETIKIEVCEEDSIEIKTEPVDFEENNDQHSFEYFSVPNDVELKSSSDRNSFDSSDKVQSVDSNQNESVTFVANSINDPLELVSFEYVSTTENETPCEKTKSNKNGTGKETGTDIKSVSGGRLKKGKENLQKQIKKLRADLKDTKAREKALQTELGARRMSELSLQEKVAELHNRLLDGLKKDRARTKLLKDLTQRLAASEKENSSRSDISEKTRKSFSEKLDRANLQLKKKNAEHKFLDIKCASLTHSLARLAAQSDCLKAEIELLKQKLVASEKSLSGALASAQTSKQHVADLTKEATVLRNSNEELQKSLLTEKKMSRFFIKERDQLLKQQNAKFEEAEKELGKLKDSVGTLTSALMVKATECRTQRRATKAVVSTYQRKSLQLKIREEEFEKRRVELEKKACEYCGF